MGTVLSSLMDGGMPRKGLVLLFPADGHSSTRWQLWRDQTTCFQEFSETGIHHCQVFSWLSRLFVALFGDLDGFCFVRVLPIMDFGFVGFCFGFACLF